MNMQTPRCVYVDFDDILSETALGFTEVLEQVFGKRVAFEEIFSFDLGRSFDLSPEDTAELMRRMHAPDVLLALRPVQGARDGLRAWREAGCELHVVTGRPPATRAVSEQWLRAHDMPYDALFFVDKYARNHPPCAEDNAITLDQLSAMRFCLAVEDSPVMIQFFVQRMTGQLVILDRPWNRHEPGAGRPGGASLPKATGPGRDGSPSRPGNRATLREADDSCVVRCQNWNEIMRRFPRPGG